MKAAVIKKFLKQKFCFILNYGQRLLVDLHKIPMLNFEFYVLRFITCDKRFWKFWVCIWGAHLELFQYSAVWQKSHVLVGLINGSDKVVSKLQNTHLKKNKVQNKILHTPIKYSCAGWKWHPHWINPIGMRSLWQCKTHNLLNFWHSF